MHKRFVSCAAVLAAGLFPSCALAQTALSSIPAQPLATEAASAKTVVPACADCITIPKLTPVRVEVLSELGSKLSKTGDMFPIRLAYPLIIDGKIIVPAGVTGMGEVIFAKGSGGGGAGGELVLAARYVDAGGKRVPLRSLQLNTVGQSRVSTANALGIAGGAGGAIVGLFMKGKQSVVAAGTIADAKTAQDISFTSDEIATAAAALPKTEPLAPSVAQPVPVAQPVLQEKGKQS